jgi:hypothetical protein
MAGIRKEKVGENLVGSLKSLVLVLGLIILLISPCFGMDALTQDEMGDLSGRIGLSIQFSSPGTVSGVAATFSGLNFGDSDGWGGTTPGDDNPGWLVLTGMDGTQTARLSVGVKDGTQLDIDVGTNDTNNPCNVAGGSPYLGIAVPAHTSFFSFSLTDTDIVLVTPETIKIALTDTPASPADADVMGYMRAENVKIAKESGRLSQCFIWAH